MENLMKKAFTSLLVLITFSCYGWGVQAKGPTSRQVSTCLLGLPPVILISQDMRDMNFSKSPLVDAFWDFESTQKGKGFSHQYENTFCKARISFYSDNQGRLSNNKVLRELKEKTSFPVDRQRNLKISRIKFYGVYGQDEDVSNTLLMGNYKDNFLRIRTTCSILPRFSEEEYERKVDEMTTIFTEAIVDAFKACM